MPEMAGRGAGGFCERRGNVCLPGNRHSPESAVDTPGGLVGARAGDGGPEGL